ncbi:hypothetical protein DOE76_09130 [Leifsonia sp. ku-ls]|nr:hypothetical protein DOE76_09130 [Leifsonia sp. ku-ls]
MTSGGWGGGRRRLLAFAAALSVLALLSGCSLGLTRPHHRPDDRSALPVLSVHGQRIEPSEVVYRVGGKTRRPAREHAETPSVTLRPAHRLRMRVVSGYPAEEVRVGVFSGVDAKGAARDGGDQFDCLDGGSACRMDTRAGSVHLSVPVTPSVRLVIVRENFRLGRAATLELVWRFQVTAAAP